MDETHPYDKTLLNNPGAGRWRAGGEEVVSAVTKLNSYFQGFAKQRENLKPEREVHTQTMSGVEFSRSSAVQSRCVGGTEMDRRQVGAPTSNTSSVEQEGGQSPAAREVTPRCP